MNFDVVDNTQAVSIVTASDDLKRIWFKSEQCWFLNLAQNKVNITRLLNDRNN